MSRSASVEALLPLFKRDSFSLSDFLVSPEANLGQLEEAAHKLDQQLTLELEGCHEELLYSAGDIDVVGDELGSLSQSVSGLTRTLNHLKSTCLEPFEKIKKQAHLLKRMHQTSLLLRQISRFIQEAERLRKDLDGKSRDYAKAAHTLHELDKLMDQKDFDLQEITVLQPEIAWIKQQGRKLKQKASQDLRQGLTANNQIQLSVATQAFFNLGSLWDEVKAALDEIIEQTLHRKLLLSPPNAANVEAYLNHVVHHAKNSVCSLDTLLATKVDSVTHESFAENVAQGGVASVFLYFWERATGLVATQLLHLAQEEKVGRSILSEYPGIEGACRRCAESFRGVRTVEELQDPVLNKLRPLRDAYMQLSLQRVTEPLGVMFAGTGFAVKSDLQRYTDILISEYLRAEKANCLVFFEQHVIQNLRSSLGQLGAEFEKRVDRTTLTWQFGEAMPEAQHANAHVLSAASFVMQSLQNSPLKTYMSPQLRRLYTLQQQVVGPVLDQCVAKQKEAVANNALEDVNTRVKAYLAVFPASSLYQFLSGAAASVFHHFLDILMTKVPKSEALYQLQVFESHMRIVGDPEALCPFEMTICRHLQHLFAHTEYANLPALLDVLNAKDIPAVPIFQQTAFRDALVACFDAPVAHTEVRTSGATEIPSRGSSAMNSPLPASIRQSSVASAASSSLPPTMHHHLAPSSSIPHQPSSGSSTVPTPAIVHQASGVGLPAPTPHVTFPVAGFSSASASDYPPFDSSVETGGGTVPFVPSNARIPSAHYGTLPTGTWSHGDNQNGEQAPTQFATHPENTLGSDNQLYCEYGFASVHGGGTALPPPTTVPFAQPCPDGGAALSAPAHHHAALSGATENGKARQS